MSSYLISTTGHPWGKAKDRSRRAKATRSSARSLVATTGVVRCGQNPMGSSSADRRTKVAGRRPPSPQPGHSGGARLPDHARAQTPPGRALHNCRHRHRATGIITEEVSPRLLSPSPPFPPTLFFSYASQRRVQPHLPCLVPLRWNIEDGSTVKTKHSCPHCDSTMNPGIGMR